MSQTDLRPAGRPRLVSDDDIFDALTLIITKHGPSGFTLNNVASQVGLTGPALGYRFKNKHGLLLAFAARQASATDEYFDRVIGDAASARDAIVDGLVGISDGMKTKTDVANNVAMLHLDLTQDDLGQHAAVQARVIRCRLDELVATAGVEDTPTRDEIVDDLYITWSGATTSWAIDGTGELSEWIRVRVERILSRNNL